MLRWHPKDYSNNDYKKVFEALINVVETYQVTFKNPELVLCQLVTNVVVVVANRDVLGAANPVQIGSFKSTVADSMKAHIFLYGENGHKYKQIKDYLENDFSKVKDNYPTTVQRAVHLLNT